jgi:hypothetical protein
VSNGFLASANHCPDQSSYADSELLIEFDSFHFCFSASR